MPCPLRRDRDSRLVVSFVLRSSRFALLLVAFLFLARVALADDPWNKQPDRWNIAEAYRILQDSPWSPSKSRLEVTLSNTRRTDPLTHMPSEAPTAPRDAGPQLNVNLGRGNPLPTVSVLWWSSRTVRLAQLRLRQLRDPSAPPAPLQVQPLPDFVIIVEGSEALPILRDAGDDLRQSAYLETPHGMALDTSSIEFHEGEKAGEDFVAFHFPRQVNGHPTVPPDTEQLIFHCKAVAKKEQGSRPNSLTLRVIFEPARMRALGQSDL